MDLPIFFAHSDDIKSFVLYIEYIRVHPLCLMKNAGIFFVCFSMRTLWLHIIKKIHYPETRQPPWIINFNSISPPGILTRIGAAR